MSPPAGVTITHPGRTGHEGASTGALLGDWTTEDLDVNEIWTADGRVIGARGADALRNNPYYAALFNAMKDGVVGAEGLRFKSGYKLEAGADEDDDQKKARLVAEKMHRRAVDTCLKRGLADCRLDAQGLLSWPALQAVALTTKGTWGEFIAQRILKPQRGGRPTHETCWRVIHPARVVTPLEVPDGVDVVDGIELDREGEPVAMHIASRHPNAIFRHGPVGTVRVPIFTETGRRQLVWYAARNHPEQRRGFGWIGPVMKLIRYVGKITEAHVVVKRLQACIGMIFEVDDPKKAAAADRNGEVLKLDTKWVPGKNYYVGKGILKSLRTIDFKYNGADFDAFTNQLLMVICAAFGNGIPYQAVLRQLTKANLASSRAALMQMWRALRGEQEELITHVAKPMVSSLLEEDLARGRLVLPTGDDLDAVLEGTWLRPPKLTVDDYRDWQASSLKKDMGVSPTTILAEHDYDADQEDEQTRRDLDRKDDLDLPAPAAATHTPDPIDEDERESRESEEEEPAPAGPDDDDDEEGEE